jgi:excisionase family DNA binding protein
MSLTNTALDAGPIVVSVRKARQLLDLSHHQIYRLINRGELQSAKFGRARRITVASIQDYIKRHLEAA